MTPPNPQSVGELLRHSGVEPLEVSGSLETIVKSLSVNGQHSEHGSAFVALKGTRTDSHLFIGDAVERGATTIFTECETATYPGVTMVRVGSTREVLGLLAHAFHGHPSREMMVCGITGTNGKTTSTHIVESVLRSAGREPGIIGTLGAKFKGRHIPSESTTPGPLELAGMFRTMSQAGVDSVVMEVSSHSLDQYRVNGVRFRAGALTNITQDHLDYHGTMENYIAAKRRLFQDYIGRTHGAVACFNIDDPVGAEMTRTYHGDCLGFASHPAAGAAIWAEDAIFSAHGTTFELLIEGWRAEVKSQLSGHFNLSNMLTAAACCYAMGISREQIVDGLNRAGSVAGRFEFINRRQAFSAIVDYAHTPDALERVLKAARRVCANKLIVAFGCGGERDRAKRAIMGKIAGDLADFVIVTSDNPRGEEPAAIAREVREGVAKSRLENRRCHVVLDRFQAIDQALHLASPGDVVVIAGKGHEDYQLIGGLRLPFDDREVAGRVLDEIVRNFSPVFESEIAQGVR